MPVEGDPACAPVPGCVDGWVALHERFGRLPLETLLEPARRHAADGFATSAALAEASGAIAGLSEAADYTAGGSLRPGQVVHRPGVARALDAIAHEGRRGFYEGEFGERLLELGNGEYTAADLARCQADWVEPLGLAAFGRRLWSLPPNSQGYLLLCSAAIASGLQLPEPDHPDWAHLLIEASREAAADRELVWHEASDGAALIAPDRTEAMRARIVTRRAGVAQPPAVPGGTVSICVVDGEGTAVSMLQSNFLAWGSLLIVPGVQVFLHNRGSCFSLRPGHPAEYGPGRRPPHTLAPALVTGAGGSLEAALATRGGYVQPQVLLQLLARVYRGGESPGEALAAGRWALAGDRVLLERNAPDRWFDELIARGHRVQRRGPFEDEFGHAQLILRDGDHLAAASDPRSPGWGVATL
jgi:gamma-glutamyltranspeptidase/glutathione hydrolase